MNWTQPVCDPCWVDKEGDRAPIRVASELGAERENCCHCGKETYSGIYLRVDPTTVPVPSQEEY